MKEFEEYLEKTVRPAFSSRVGECMDYSLMAGGKRMRPLLLLSLLKDYGKEEKEGFPAAAALEMVHTYSLIHDDLPAMDNDDLRRGRATAHKAYDEATAILAGDALLTKSFEVLADHYEPETAIQLVKILSNAAGADGMILGQALDLDFEGEKNVTEADLMEIDFYKTGKLLTAPLLMAGTIAGKKDDLPILEKIGENIGLLFQIQDDILDATSSEEVMGKTLSDSRLEKTTAVTIYGLEQAREKLESLTQETKGLLERLGQGFDHTASVIDLIINRNH